jgi:hypothetical protein
MLPTEKISKYVNYGEIIRSDTAKRTGIFNEPNAEQLEKIKLLCVEVYDKCRGHFNTPIYISSCFRSPAINKLVKGQPNSQHTKGEAIDMDCDVFGNVTNFELFNWIKENLTFDQLLYEGGEHGWVHCSLKSEENRMFVGTIPNP